MALSDKRKLLIEYVKSKAEYLAQNSKVLDIYRGNLLPYLDAAMQSSLSGAYYQAIRPRILPINIMQRYVDKVATTYSKAPTRLSAEKIQQDFVSQYVDIFDMNTLGAIADTYAQMFKGFAWEPYVNDHGIPGLRELAFDRFVVYSDSPTSPEVATIFVKFMGKVDDKELYFAYSDEEFDAFYDDGSSASSFMLENQGINLYGTIPYLYGRRDKNKLMPQQDSDILSMAIAIPLMMSDAAGAQMFQAFSIFYGIDVDSQGLVMSPNAFWNFRSLADSDKDPQVGTVKPEADTDKVVTFVMNAFVMWLETKGIRVGSVGSITGSSFASGVSKVVDEMDVYDIKKKSIEWFKRDEERFWNKKMPKIHNHWIKAQMVDTRHVPGMIPEGVEMSVRVDFEKPVPFISRAEELTNAEKEVVGLRTMTREMAIRRLHPEYSEEEFKAVLSIPEVL